MGPHCANAFDPHSWGTITDAVTLEVMRIVLVIGLFAIGVELPRSYMAKHGKGLVAMVVPTMAIGWVTVASMRMLYYVNMPMTLLVGLIYLLFPQLDFISCLVIAACLTPTDPIICATIVGELLLLNEFEVDAEEHPAGKFAVQNVPLELRHILSAESAANDGLAYPFLTISLYLIHESSNGAAIGRWILIGCLCTSNHFMTRVPTQISGACRPSDSWCVHWLHTRSAPLFLLCKARFSCQ